MKHRVIVLFALMAPALAFAQPSELRVRLYWIQSPSVVRIVAGESDAKVQVCPPCKDTPLVGSLEVKALAERLQINPGHRSAESVRVSGSFRIQIQPDPPLQMSYPLETRAAKGRLLLTLQIPLEDYVAGVLAGESSVFRSQESLKAMAVAVRTFAVRFRGRHQPEDFDFCDTTHCQDFRLRAVSERLQAAAEATEGELLWHEGLPAATYYHRNCGGTTEASQFVWSGVKAPYLRQQVDGFCVARNRGEWHSEIRKDELPRALVSAGLRVPSSLDSIIVASRTPSGRIERLRLSGSTTTIIPASDFRLAIGRALGWDRIRSNLYDVHDAGDRWVFHGYGSGHGVGLCQIGTAQMGEEGKTYREILAFYYPGTTLGLTAKGLSWKALSGERAELLTTQPNEDHRLLALTERLLHEAEEGTGWDFKTRPQVKVYPSVAVFRNATGQPGWVAASTRGRVIRTQPTKVLHSAGSLARTLQHELLHLLVESRAGSNVPLWFREGVVLYLMEGNRRVKASHNVPNLAALDQFFLRAQSQQEMLVAYEAALLHVQQLIEKYGKEAVLSWVETGLPPELVSRLRAPEPAKR